MNANLIETLEGRQLLSASTADPASLIAASHVSMPLVVHAGTAKAKPVVTTTPSLVHNYAGKIKTEGFLFGIGSRRLDFKLLITGQTTDTLTGHFEVGDTSGDATLHGFEKTNGRFSYSTKSNGFTFKIDGKVSNNGLTLGGHGSIKVTSASVFKTSGGFVVNATP
jgi:hypothetical protein